MEKSTSSTTKYCLNCHYPLPKSADYCHKCSQKVTDGKINFGEMISEFFGAVFNWDSRFFRTLGALFVPGKLTTEYFKGRHRRFVHPLRVFLVMTLALIATITFQIDDEERDLMQFGQRLDESKTSLAKQEVFFDLDTIKNETIEEYKNTKVAEALDSVVVRLMKKQKLTEKDSTSLGNINMGFSDLNKVSNADLFELEIEEILDKYQVEGIWARMEVTQKIRVMKQGGNFGLYLIKNVSWMIFLMMPFLALILKLLYVRRKYYYVEHLIFSFHTHAFVFLIYILLFLAPENTPDWINQALLLAICIYLYLAMRRVYQQGWFKTLMKYILMGIFYFIILLVAIIATFLVSFALF